MGFWVPVMFSLSTPSNPTLATAKKSLARNPPKLPPLRQNLLRPPKPPPPQQPPSPPPPRRSHAKLSCFGCTSSPSLPFAHLPNTVHVSACTRCPQLHSPESARGQAIV